MLTPEQFHLLAAPTHAPGPPPVTLSRVTASTERIFRRDGLPWRYKGVTAFQALDRYVHDRPGLDAFLAAFEPLGYTVLRVFRYTPVADWGAKAWEPSDPHTLDFLAYVGARGWYVELVLLTDDDPTRVLAAEQVALALALENPPNLFVEVGNEPSTHKAIDTAHFRSLLSASDLLHSSGDYEDGAAKHYGRYLTAHGPRDDEWPRKSGKNLREFYDGGGPDAPTDAPHHLPCAEDELIRPDQAGYVGLDFYAAAANIALHGGGGTFHFERGKYALPPTADEQVCADLFALGLDVFPADACLGAYGRIDEGSDTLRTYTVGNYCVRIRPTNKNTPGAWTVPLDDWGIAWRKP